MLKIINRKNLWRRIQIFIKWKTFKFENWCKRSKMSKNRFGEIHFTLHWCENESWDKLKDTNTGKIDTLYKIRSLLTVIQHYLRRYIDPCTEYSLDETCIAIISQFERSIIFNNLIKTQRKTSLEILYITWKRSLVCFHHKIYIIETRKKKTRLRHDINSDVQLTNNVDDSWEKTLWSNGGDDGTIISNEEANLGYDVKHKKGKIWK